MPNQTTTFQISNRKGFLFERFYRSWVIGFCLVGLTGTLTFYYIDAWNWWIGSMSLLFLIYIFKGHNALPKLPFLIGYANIVTITRLCIIIGSMILSEHLSDLQLFLILLVAILMDGLDGVLARIFNQTSKFGEVLDMEGDAFLVAALSIYHVNHGTAPVWILLPGFMRFSFGLLNSFIPNEFKEFTSKKFRATIAVVFFFSLVLPFIVPQPISTWILQIAGALILLSFGLSLIGLFARSNNVNQTRKIKDIKTKIG